MAVSRPLLVALILAVVAFAVVTAMRSMGGGQAAEEGTSQSAAQTSASRQGHGGSAAGASPSKPAAARAKARPAAPAKKAERAAHGTGPQARVMRAIADRQVVVLFFGQRSAADDRATRRAVEDLNREREQVAVFNASIDDVARYSRILAGVGVQQSPSTVVIDRGGRARLVEGFVDEGSLRQLVADAR